MSALLEDAIKELLEQETNPLFILNLSAHYLDIHAGPYEMVLHRTGPYVKGTQICIQCGRTLIADGSSGFLENQLVGEAWRWGLPFAPLFSVDEAKLSEAALPAQRRCA